MQVPAQYAVLLFALYLLHYAVLIGGVSFVLEKRTRLLGGLIIIADLLLIVEQTCIEGYFLFHNLNSYCWAGLLIAIVLIITVLRQYTRLGDKQLLDQTFRKRYAKVFTILFWLFLASAWIKLIWRIH
jgi:hypothetical protein